ncbi:MAG: hypoxanthine phosphoribosyltransferase [bacterium]|nr:hypoxanthine phosphoribosyltransferase [bacterium]
MLGPILIGENELHECVEQLAERIRQDLSDQSPVFIGVLKGCVYFFADLTRAIDHPIEVDFIQTSSYGSSTSSSGTVTLLKDITVDIRDRDVFIVEDIVDTGITLTDLRNLLLARHPRSLKVVALLSKPSRREIDVEVDYVGMEIEDRFAVGYGLDFAQQYRNLREIHELVQD